MIALALAQGLLATAGAAGELQQASGTAALTGITATGYVDLTIPSRRDYAFDDDGVLYVTAADEVVRYDTQAGAFLPPFVVAGGVLMGIDLSPDGQTLAVADTQTQGNFNRILLVDTATGVPTAASFQRKIGEAGTFMVAWGADGRVLVTSSYSGSGWVPLRRYDPATQTTEELDSVRQNTMLAASTPRRHVALVESNISSGPVHVLDVATGGYLATENTGWFTFEVALSPDARRLVVPTYNGAYVFGNSGTQLVQLGLLGQYATTGPISAVFSPVRDVFFTAEWGSNPGVKVYSAETLQVIATIDSYAFPWQGNVSMAQGRMEISPDGRHLAVSVGPGVRLYSF